jgi:hypothetical protein
VLRRNAIEFHLSSMSNTPLTEAKNDGRETPKRLVPFQVDYEPVTTVDEEDEGEDDEENYHDDFESDEGRLDESNFDDTMTHHGSSNRKRGHRCCFIFCDMRRAVLFADALYFTVNAIVYYADHRNTASHDSYYLSTGHAASLLDIPYHKMLQIQCIAIYGGTLCGMVGALYYKAGLVVLAGLFHAVTALWRMGGEQNVAGMVTSLMFGYPHVFYVYEVRTGILTRDNYAAQEQSYCYGC